MISLNLFTQDYNTENNLDKINMMILMPNLLKDFNCDFMIKHIFQCYS